MTFQNINDTGTENAPYGNSPASRGGTGPLRLNQTDIRSMTIYDPVVADQMTLATNDTWQQLTLTDATGNTLENGVRIKNITNDIVNVGYYHPDTATGTTGGAGFQLEDREEIFLEVRYLTDVRVQSPDSSAAQISYIAS